MIDIDNTQPEDYHHDQEPDTQDVIDDDQGYDEYKEKRAGLFEQMGIKDQEPDLDSLKLDYVTKKDYNAYMANPDNFSDEESTDDMTPEQTNGWLRDAGF